MTARLPTKRRFQFSITSILVSMVVVSLALVFWRLAPELFWVSLAGVVVANLLGIAVGLFITRMLRFPNDGSLHSAAETTEVSDD